MAQWISQDRTPLRGLPTIMVIWYIVTVYSCPSNNNVFTSTGGSATIQYNVNSLPFSNTLMTYQMKDPGGTTQAQFNAQSGHITSSGVQVLNLTFTGDASTGNLSFMIDNIQTVDTGVYDMVKSTETDTPLLCNTVYITGDLNTPIVTANKSPSVGESVILTCSSSSTTVPAGLPLFYTWQVDGAINPSDPRYTYSTSRDTLAISGVQRSDTNTRFTCTGQEQESQVTSTTSDQFRIDVRYGPENVRLDPSSISYIKTENTTLGPITCTADCNPTCTYIWTHLNSTWSTNNAILNLDHISRNEAGVYRCTATRSSGNQGSVDLALKVHYCPDVSVTTTHITTQDSFVDIVCSPSGVPDQYTFSQWTHQWDINGQILNHPGLGNNPVLKMTNLKYSHSGVYTCHASNGIECSRNQNAGRGQVTLLVKAAPVIIDQQSRSNDRIQVASKINSAAMLNITFWSNAGNVDIRCYRIKDNAWLNSPEVEIVQTQTTVRLPVFSSYVSTIGTLASVSVRINHKEEFGEYDIVLSNGIGVDRRLEMLIVLQGPPQTPTLEGLQVLSPSSVSVKWRRGFHGGRDQTIVIQISTNNINWQNRTAISDGQIIEPCSVTTYLQELSQSTVYFMRMFAYNDEGISDSFTDIFNLTTHVGQAVQEESRVDVGTVVGSVGAVLVCVAVMVVAYIVYRRYTCIRRPEERTASKDVPMTERHNEGSNEIANPDHVYNDIQQTASEEPAAIRDGANIYEKPVAISSQEHVYSDIKHDAKKDKVYINMKKP